MGTDIPEERVTGRAVPLPEERDGASDEDARRGAAEQILRDSERRLAEAAGADAPGSVADEHRRSAETSGP